MSSDVAEKKGEGGEAPKPPDDASYALPHHYTFSAMYNIVSGAYRTRHDEALRENIINALAMRRDGLIDELLWHRMYPTIETPHRLEPEKKKDKGQEGVCGELMKIIDAIPRFQDLKFSLKEDIFYGRAGVQIKIGRKRVGGKQMWTIVDHEPVNGDKIVFKQGSNLPGIMCNATFRPERGNVLEPTDKGMALFLGDPYYRDRFLISKFQPTDTDFRFEGDKAGAINGLGLRDRLYWPYWLRQEVLSWHLDGLQRVGSNGMLYAFYEAGNKEALEATIQALQTIVRENIAAFPVLPGMPPGNRIEQIQPAGISYEVQFRLIEYLDSLIRRVILGQTLSGETAATGMGSGVADLQEGTFQQIVRYDSNSLAEVLTDQLLGLLIRLNYGELPFTVKLRLQNERSDVGERLATAQILFSMGLPLSRESLYEASGFAPPKDPSDAISATPGMQAGEGPGLPKGLDAGIPSIARDAMDGSVGNSQAA